EMVNKLWFGLKQEIEEHLWLKRLNPEGSNFWEVQQVAEMIELSLAVMFKPSQKKNDNSVKKLKTPDQSNPRKNNDTQQSVRCGSKDGSFYSKKMNTSPNFNSNEYQ
ncbi:hypothetical protein P691DRAFT_688301, partial [Macrolepiota fuliginosa MF-IS2]